MKRFLSLLLAMLMLCCTACAEEEIALTLTFSAPDYYTGEPIICQLTYDPQRIYPNLGVWESTEPVADLAYDMVEFYHLESGSQYMLEFQSGYFSAATYFNDQVEYWNKSSSGTQYNYHEFTELTIADAPAYSFLQEINWEDGHTSYIKTWALEFEAGLMLIKCSSSGNYFSSEDSGIAEVASGISVNGSAFGASNTGYTLYDYNTGEPVYDVTFLSKVFSLNETCDPTTGEMILNYVDTSLPYSEMKIHVNKYSSGDSYFASKKEYSMGISYLGSPGNYLDQGGMIGEAMSYTALGLGRNSMRGRVFFAEMPDGNVITIDVPGADISDELYVPMAFLTINPAK